MKKPQQIGLPHTKKRCVVKYFQEKYGFYEAGLFPSLFASLSARTFLKSLKRSADGRCSNDPKLFLKYFQNLGILLGN